MVSKILTLWVILMIVTCNIVEVLNPDNLDGYDWDFSLDDEEPYKNNSMDAITTTWVYRFGVPEPCDREALQESRNAVWKLCSSGVFTTCVGRCGNIPRGVPYTCACDPLCQFYNDCCYDYNSECQHGVNISSNNNNLFYKTGQFECVPIDTESRDSVLMVSKCSKWWSRDPQHDAESQRCENGTSEAVLPVTSKSSNLVFRNVHCAICNGYNDVVAWTIQRKCSNYSLFSVAASQLLDFPVTNDTCPVSRYVPPILYEDFRVCSYDIGSCMRKSNITTSQSDIDKCSSFSKPIIGQLAKDGQPQIYKNVYCATCNGIELDDLYCPAWNVFVSSDSDQPGSLNGMVPKFTNDWESHKSHVGDDIPAAFTILFNFGNDGLMKTLFDSQDQEIWDKTKANCKDLEIWDPFTNMCRTIYCSSEFVLVNFQCVKMYDNSTASKGQLVDNSSLVEALLRQDMSTVEMSLNIRLNKPISKNVEETLERNFLYTLANSVAASSDRFANFTLVVNDTIHNNVTYDSDEDMIRNTPKGFKSQVTFLLSECHDGADNLSEPSIVKIVSSLSAGISMSQYFLQIENNITVHLTGISEKVVANLNNSELLNWCDQGHKLYYENNDIVPIFSQVDDCDVAMDVHVIATNITYHPGQYLASIVIQGSQANREANFSGYVIVCHEIPENNCTRVAIPVSEYILLSNMSLLYLGIGNIPSIFDEDSYEILQDGTALVCYSVAPYDPSGNGGAYAPDLDNDLAQRITSTVLTGISLLAGILTMVTYASFAKLRNMPGIYVLNLTGCLWIFQFIFVLGERPSVYTNYPIECKVVSIVVHYFGLCYFFWMNVIAYDLHRTFCLGAKMLKAISDRSTRSALRLFVYAYGCPAVIVGMCTVFNFVHLPVDIRIDYGTGGLCWIGNPMALFFSFVVVIGIVLVTNVAFYIRTVLFIRRIHRATKVSTGHVSKRAHSIVYIRIATILGFTWILGFFITTPFDWVFLNVILAYVFIVLNASHGTLIFMVFVCNVKVYKYYCQSSLKSVFKFRKCSVCRKVICACQKPVIRTVSNETTRSVVSVTIDHKKNNEKKEVKS